MLLDAEYLLFTDVTLSTPAVSLHVARDSASVSRAIARWARTVNEHSSAQAGGRGAALLPAFFLVTVNSVDLSRLHLDEVASGVVVVTVQPNVSSVRHAVLSLDGARASSSSSLSVLHSTRSSLVTELEHCPVPLRTGQQVAAFLLLRCKCIAPIGILGQLMLHTAWLGDQATLAALATHVLDLHGIAPRLFKTQLSSQTTTTTTTTTTPMPYKLSALRSSEGSKAAMNISVDGIGLPPPNTTINVLIVCSDTYDTRAVDAWEARNRSPELPPGPTIASAQPGQRSTNSGLNISSTANNPVSSGPLRRRPLVLPYAISAILQSLQRGDRVACVCGEELLIPPTTTVPREGGQAIPLRSHNKQQHAGMSGGHPPDQKQHRRLVAESAWMRALDVLVQWSNDEVYAQAPTTLVIYLSFDGSDNSSTEEIFAPDAYIRRNPAFYHTTVSAHLITDSHPPQCTTGGTSLAHRCFAAAAESFGGFYVAHDELALRHNVEHALRRQRMMCLQSATSIFLSSGGGTTTPHAAGVRSTTGSSTYQVRELAKVGGRCVHHGRIASRDTAHAVFELTEEDAMDGAVCICLMERAPLYSAAGSVGFSTTEAVSQVDVRVIHANRIARIHDDPNGASSPLAQSWWLATSALRSILLNRGTAAPHLAAMAIDKAWISVSERIRLCAPTFFETIAAKLQRARTLVDVEYFLLEGLSRLYVLADTSSLQVEAPERCHHRDDGLVDTQDFSVMGRTHGATDPKLLMSSIMADSNVSDAPNSNQRLLHQARQVNGSRDNASSLIPVTQRRTLGGPQVVSGVLRGAESVVQTHNSSSSFHSPGNHSDPHASTFNISTADSGQSTTDEEDEQDVDVTTQQPIMRVSSHRPQQLHHSSHMSPRKKVGSAARRRHQADIHNNNNNEKQEAEEDDDNDVVAHVHIATTSSSMPPQPVLFNNAIKEHVMADPRWLALELPLSSSTDGGGGGGGGENTTTTTRHSASSFPKVPSASSLQAAITPCLPSGAITVSSFSLRLSTLHGTSVYVEFPALTPLIKRGVQLAARALILCRVDVKHNYLDCVETAKLPVAVTGVNAPAEHAFYNLERGATYCVVHVASTKEPSEWITFGDIAIADGIEFTTPQFVAEMLRVTDVYARSVALEWEGNAPGYIVTAQRVLHDDGHAAADWAGQQRERGRRGPPTHRMDDNDHEQDLISGGHYAIAATYHTAQPSFNLTGLLPGSVYHVTVAPSLPSTTTSHSPHETEQRMPSSLESCEHVVATMMEPNVRDLAVQASFVDGDNDDDGHYADDGHHAARAGGARRVRVAVAYPPFVAIFHEHQLSVEAVVEVEGLRPPDGVVHVAPGRVLEIDVRFSVKVTNRISGVVLLQKDSMLNLNTHIGPFDVIFSASVHHVAADSADIHWAGTGDQFMIEVVSENDEDRCVAVGSGQSQVTLSDLRPSTEYLARVKGSKTINVITTSFRTLPSRPLASTVVVAHSAARHELHVTLPPAVHRFLQGYHHQGTQKVEHQALVWPLDQLLVNEDTEASNTTVLDVAVLSGIHGQQWRTAQGSSFQPLHVEVRQRVTIDDTSAPLESVPAVVAVVTDVHATIEADGVTIHWFSPTGTDPACVPAYASPDGRRWGSEVGMEEPAARKRTFHVSVGKQMQTVRGVLSASFRIPVASDIFQRVVVTGPEIAQELSTHYVILAPPAPSPSLIHATVFDDHAVLELSHRLNGILDEFVPRDLQHLVEVSVEITSACFPPIQVPLPVHEKLRVRVPLMLNRYQGACVDLRTVINVLSPLRALTAEVSGRAGQAKHRPMDEGSPPVVVEDGSRRIDADAPLFLNRVAMSPNVMIATPLVHPITDMEVVELQPRRAVLRWFSSNSAHEVHISSGDGLQSSCRAVQPFVVLEELEAESCYKVSVQGKESGGHTGVIYFVTPPLLTTAFVGEVVQSVSVHGMSLAFDLPQTKLVATRVDGGEGTIKTTTHAQLQFPPTSAPTEPIVWCSSEEGSTTCKSTLPRSVRHGERWPWLSLDSVSECTAGESVGKIVSLTSHAQDRQTHRIDLVGGVKLEDINEERCVISWMGSASAYLLSHRKPAVDLDDTPDLGDGIGGLLTKPTVVRTNTCRHVLDFATGDSSSIYFIQLQGDDGPSNVVKFSLIVPPRSHYCSVMRYTPSTVSVALPRARKSAFLVTGCYVLVNDVKHSHSNTSDDDEVFHVPLDVARTILRPRDMNVPPPAGGGAQDGSRNKATHGCLLTVVHHAEPRPPMTNTAERPGAVGATSETDISSLLGSFPSLNHRCETTTTKSLSKLHPLADPALRRVDATSAEVSWTSSDTEFYVEIIQYLTTPPTRDRDSSSAGDSMMLHPQQQEVGMSVAPPKGPFRPSRTEPLEDVSAIHNPFSMGDELDSTPDDRAPHGGGALVRHRGVEEVPFVTRNVVTASSHINLRTLQPGALHTIRVRGRHCGDVQIELNFLTQPLFADQSIVLRRQANGNTFTLLAHKSASLVRCGDFALYDETKVELIDATPPSVRREQLAQRKKLSRDAMMQQHAPADVEEAERRRNRPPRPHKGSGMPPPFNDDNDDRREPPGDDGDDSIVGDVLVEELRVPAGDDGVEFTVHAPLTVIKVVRVLSCEWEHHLIQNNHLKTELVIAKVPLVATLSHLQLSRVEPNQCTLQWICSHSTAKFTVVATPIASFQSVSTNNGAAAVVPSEEQRRRPSTSTAVIPTMGSMSAATALLPQRCVGTTKPDVLVASLAPSTLYEMTVSEDCSYKMTTNRTTRCLVVYDDAPETPTLKAFMVTQPRKAIGGGMKRYIGGMTLSINPACAYDRASGLMMYYAARVIPDNTIVSAVAPCRTDVASIPAPTLPVSASKPVFITANPSVNSEEIFDAPTQHKAADATQDAGRSSFYTTDINMTEPAGRLTHRVEWFQVVEVHEQSPFRVNTINPLQFSEAEVQHVELVRVIHRPQLSHVTSKRATIQWSTSHEEMRCEVALQCICPAATSTTNAPATTTAAPPTIYRVVENEISLESLVPGAAYEVTITPSYHNATCEAIAFVMLTAPRKPKPPDIHVLLLNAVFDLPATRRLSHFTAAQAGVAVSLTTTHTALVICDKEVDVSQCTTATDYLEKTQARNVFKSTDTAQRIDLRLRSGRSYIFVFFASLHHPMAVNGILHSKPCVVPHRTDCYAPSNLHVISRTKSSITVGWSSVDVGSKLLRFVVEMVPIHQWVAPIHRQGAENAEEEEARKHSTAAAMMPMSVTMSQLFGPSAAAVGAAPQSSRSGKFKSLGLRQQMAGNTQQDAATPEEGLTPLQRLQMAFEDGDRTDGGKQQLVVETSASKPEMHATFSFLSSGVQYAFRVRQVPTGATSAQQPDGPSSGWSTVLVTETASPPKPVEKLQVVGVTSSAIRLAWIDRQATDADHIAYFVEWKTTERSSSNTAVSAKKVQEMKVHTCQCEIGGLLPGATYRVTVTPVNASGEACTSNNAAVMVRTEAPQNWRI